MKKFFYASFMAFVSCFSSFATGPSNGSQSAQSQEYDGIIAIVNDDIITFQDLQDRINLMLFSAGGALSEEMKARMVIEILREMILEKLRWQCAKKYAPKGGWVGTKEVEAAFTDIARRNNMDYDSFCKLLEKNKINKNILLTQIRIGLSWSTYVNARFGKLINISESEMRRTIAEIKEKQNQKSFYVSRIFLPVTNPKNENAVFSNANNILGMLKNKADFGFLARQFSKSPDANNGGEIGWVFQGQLSSEEYEKLQSMSVGDVALVRNSRGYVILYLQDKKAAGPKTFTNVKFAQVAVSFRDPNPGQENINQVVNYLNDLKKNSKSCQEFMNSAKASGFCGVSDPMAVTLEGMQPQFRGFVGSLRNGEIGSPIVTPQGIVVICMLDRKTITLPEPTRNDILAQKTNERLSVFADRETQDLKKRADIKLINEKYRPSLDFNK